MPLDAKLSNEEKARSVLCRTGQAGNRCHGLAEAELAELAAVYDTCETDNSQLGQLVGEFWGRRQARLDELKATSSDQPESLFRNRNARS